MKETKTLEFKEKITDSFLKTVCAFSNFGGGTIIFGINDDGKAVGISSIEKATNQIESKINETISPKPDFTIEKNTNKKTITLIIKDGMLKPYFYNNKIYKRNNTSTVLVDSIEQNRMILKGSNINFEDLESTNQKLSFETLKQRIMKSKNLSDFNNDILRTLNLVNNELKYNNAGLIVSDINSFPGVDIVRFGDSINQLLDREIYENCSAITQFENALSMYKKYYQYEKIESSKRELIEKIPEKAFREAIANAILHRTYDVNARIRVEMYNDYIAIISPGGLPYGISNEEYMSGRVSIWRNPKLSNIFYQLSIIEQFATGIKRILESYLNKNVYPSFEILENSITVILPTLDRVDAITSDEKIILETLLKDEIISISEILKKVVFSKNKCLRLLESLISKNKIEKIGNGRGTKYKKK